MVFGGFPGNQPPPPQFVGWLFIILGGGFFIVGETLAICIIMAGRFLARRKHYLFVFVGRAANARLCRSARSLVFFTSILLSRESIKSMFD